MLLINDYPTNSVRERTIISFKCNGKVAGNMDVPVKIMYESSGNEIDQASYDQLAKGSYISGTFIYQIDFSGYINNMYGGDKQKFINDISIIYLDGSPYLLNCTTGQYTTSKYSSLSNGIANYIDENNILTAKCSSYNRSFYFSPQVSSMNNLYGNPSTIINNTNEKFAVLLQGLKYVSFDTTQKTGVLNYLLQEGECKTLVDFIQGVIPDNAVQGSSYGAIIDSKTFAYNTLSFANKGVNSSTGSIEIPITLDKDDYIYITFYVSTENVYDKFHILVDGVEQYCFSGTSDSSTTHTSIASVSFKGDSWCTAYIPNIKAGDHTITLQYKKDSSSSSGKDNVFIKTIGQGRIVDVENKFLCITSDKIDICDKSGTSLAKGSNSFSSNKFFNILLVNDETLKVYVRDYNGKIIKEEFSSIKLSCGKAVFNVLPASPYNEYTCDMCLDAVYIINNELTEDEITNMLNGTQEGFETPKILSGAICPNQKYKVTGSAKLYINKTLSRTVTGEFTTSYYENNIVLDEGAVCTKA